MLRSGNLTRLSQEHRHFKKVYAVIALTKSLGKSTCPKFPRSTASTFHFACQAGVAYKPRGSIWCPVKLAAEATHRASTPATRATKSCCCFFLSTSTLAKTMGGEGRRGLNLEGVDAKTYFLLEGGEEVKLIAALGFFFEIRKMSLFGFLYSRGLELRMTFWKSPGAKKC